MGPWLGPDPGLRVHTPRPRGIPRGTFVHGGVNGTFVHYTRKCTNVPYRTLEAGMRVRTARDLGALIRDRRSTVGWSQQELADRCGVSKRWVVGVEAGKAGAQLGLVLRALAALNLELAVGVAVRSGHDELDALLDAIDKTGHED